MAIDEISQKLGELDAKMDLVLQGQQNHSGQLSTLGGRMTTVEVSASARGAQFGTLCAIGVSLIIEGVKGKLGL